MKLLMRQFKQKKLKSQNFTGKQEWKLSQNFINRDAFPTLHLMGIVKLK